MVQQSGTAECYSRVVEQSGTAAARKQIRRDGHRRVGWLENASARTMQSQSKLEQCKSEKIPSALVVRLCALMTRGGELCVMQCLSDSSAMMISGSPGLLMDDV